MTRAARKEKNQRIASQLKAAGIERTTGRCCICSAIYHADMQKAGFASHRCAGRATKSTPGNRG